MKFKGMGWRKGHKSTTKEGKICWCGQDHGVPGMMGKKFSDVVSKEIRLERRKKISKKLKGREITAEHRKNIGKSRNGRSFPKLSDSLKKTFAHGRDAWNKGLTKKNDLRVLEYAISQSKTKKRLFGEGELEVWNKGLKAEEHPSIRKYLSSSKRTRNLKPNKLEKRFIKFIEEYKLPYKYTGDFSFWVGGLNPDFIHLNGKKIAIDVFGDYWHSPVLNPEVKETAIQATREKRFKKHGWKLIVIWDYELKDLSDEQILEKIHVGM